MQTNENIERPQREMDVKLLEALAASIAAKAADRGLTDVVFDQLMADVS